MYQLNLNQADDMSLDLKPPFFYYILDIQIYYAALKNYYYFSNINF